jgi:cell division protein FtsW (lipid II flippase)
LALDKYLKQHEEAIKQALLAGDVKTDWKALKEFHKTRIEFMQHERLIHLLVTLTFAILLFIALGIAYSRPSIEILVVMALLLVLLIPYIYHYYVLENGVQRWYKLYEEIDKKITGKSMQ